ncbi:MAG TPA: hypothetical protein VK509_05095 [Polyangiales bacterium]|nr:hypothetical protein [Polyangiales bacterium]
MDENKLSEASNEVKNKVRNAAGAANEYVDTATTTMGRGMESAAGAIAQRVDTAADGVARAGRYLQQSDPSAMGRDITDWVREHPAVSLGVGFGVGLLIGRALSR